VRRLAFVLSLLGGCSAAALFASVPMGCSDDTSLSGGDAAPEAQTTEAGDAGSDADAVVVPRGARAIGLSVEVGDLDFQRNVQTARDAGAQTTNLSFAWDDVERAYDAGAPDASGGDAGDGGDGGDAGAPSTPTQLFNPLLHVANLVLPDERMGATLTLDALDVGGSRAPAELATRAFDDVELAARYDRLTDYALDQLPDTNVTAVFVASSVDVPLGDDPAKHAAFAAFVTHAVAHVHAVRPKLKVGFVVTASGAVAEKERLAAAWAASDVIGVTYLPIDAAAQVRPVTAVGSDVDQLVAALPAGKPILLREVGYPTAPECGSDEAAQAAFVSAVFGAWDRHADRVSVVTFRELVDLEAGAAAALAQRYGRSDAAFLGFLGSLGLRSDKQAKRGLAVLIREARARGF
jgi:hypothetical protein